MDNLGFSEVITKELIFGDDPVGDIKDITTDRYCAIVAPTTVLLKLLREGYRLFEFENISYKRKFFLCSGVWLHTLEESTFSPCPIPVGEQAESYIK